MSHVCCYMPHKLTEKRFVKVSSLCAGKAYLCMGQLDEADSQYQKALALEPSNASLKAEAQLAGSVRTVLQDAQNCLDRGDPRCAVCSCQHSSNSHVCSHTTRPSQDCTSAALLSEWRLGKPADHKPQGSDDSVDGDTHETCCMLVISKMQLTPFGYWG